MALDVGDPDFSYFTENENIDYEIVKSPEIISDEYPHDNKKGLVHIFAGYRDASNVRLLRTALESLDYEIPTSHIHKIDSEEEIVKDLEKIASDNHEDKKCLIIIFLGNCLNDQTGHILSDVEKKKFCFDNIWSKFLLSKSFLNKPKIFILQATLCKGEKLYSTDSIVVNREYDLPAEADICIVYNKIKGREEDNFLQCLCENIQHFSERDDLLDIVVRSQIQEYMRPIIISTLTRKFYFSPHKTRGYQYDIENALKEVNEGVNKIQYNTTPNFDVISTGSHETFLDATRKELGKSCPDLDKKSQTNIELPTNLETNNKSGRSRSVSVSVAEITLEPTPRPRLNSKTMKKPTGRPIFKF